MTIKVIEDIDIYGQQNIDGSAIMHYEEDAIKNALIFWFTTKKGDFLLNPSAGGILSELSFKNINPRFLGQIHFRIRNLINNEFYPKIKLKEININPDFENRLLEIEIKYINPLSAKEQSVVITTKTANTETKFKYQEITYIEKNLKTWALLVQENMGGKRLLYDEVNEVWKWGRYSLINFDPDTDSYASDIFIICNS